MGLSTFLEMIFESVYQGLIIMLGVVVLRESEFDYEITAFTILIISQLMYVFNKVGFLLRFV